MSMVRESSPPLGRTSSGEFVTSSMTSGGLSQHSIGNTHLTVNTGPTVSAKVATLNSTSPARRRSLGEGRSDDGLRRQVQSEPRNPPRSALPSVTSPPYHLWPGLAVTGGRSVQAIPQSINGGTLSQVQSSLTREIVRFVSLVDQLEATHHR